MGKDESKFVAPPYNPLFRGGELQLSAFGEAGQGNIDSDPTQKVTHTTTTTTTTVAPPKPMPTGTPGGGATGIVRHGPTKAFKTTTTTVNGVTTKTTRTTRVESHDRHEHNAGGGGLAAQYFFTRNWGVQIETDFLGGTSYTTAVTGNLIYRYPFEFGAKPGGVDGKSGLGGPTWGIAPYILGGGGGQWDGHAAGIGDIGVGAEVRWSQHYGCFIEGRWIVHDSHQSYGAETAGLDYTF